MFQISYSKRVVVVVEVVMGGVGSKNKQMLIGTVTLLMLIKFLKK